MNIDEFDEVEKEFLREEVELLKAMGVQFDEKPEQPKTEVAKNISEVTSKRLELFKNGSSFLPATKDQIVGIDGVLGQIDEVIHWLRNFDAYSSYGARLEPGILFEGRPGTGKTLVSRYIATASDAIFIDVRDFDYEGQVISAKDVSELFRLARQKVSETNKPVVLFWDEFEGAAKERGKTNSAPQAAVVSQLTAELDGIDGKMRGVVLIGCTNYVETIDRALMRPGRMGLHIEFNSPDREGKKSLLEFYLSKIKTRGDIDIDTMSYFFNDWDTAATIEEAVQQAWRLAVRRAIKEGSAEPYVNDSELLEVFLDRLIGPPPTFSDLDKSILRRVAVHEMGHALAAQIFGVPLRLVTVRPGKDSLGKTMTHNVDPRAGTIEEMIQQMKVGAGSIVAERIVEIGRSGGCQGDTQTITQIAINIVDSQGVSPRTGLFNPASLRARYYNSNPSGSDEVIRDLDRDVRELIDSVTEEVTVKFDELGKDFLLNLSDILLEKQTLTGKQFSKVFDDLKAKVVA